VVENQVRHVTAMTFESDEHERPAERVHGQLIVRHVPTLGYDQYLVDGVPVDPATVEDIASNARGDFFRTCQRDEKGYCMPGEVDAAAAAARYDLHGHPVTAILRWMGKDSWKFHEARSTLDQLGLSAVSDATLKAQLYGGKTGTRGDPAPLTPDQEEHLRGVRDGKINPPPPPAPTPTPPVTVTPPLVTITPPTPPTPAPAPLSRGNKDGTWSAAEIKQVMMGRKELEPHEAAQILQSRIVGRHKLSEKDLKDLTNSIHFACQKYHGEALIKIARGVKKIVLMPLEKLREGRQGSTAVASYYPHTKLVALSNARDTSTVLHELGHAADFTKKPVKGSEQPWQHMPRCGHFTERPEWMAAWRADTIGRKEAGQKTIRYYGFTNHKEGLTVTMEHLYQFGKEGAREVAPRMTALLEKYKVCK
jgi:hypothetical protein